MSVPIPTPATFAVFLITQGCLPAIFEPGAVQGQSPIEGHALTEAERRKIGLTTPGATVGYRIAETDVFLDLAGDQATVWFAGGDHAAAPLLLEEYLRKIFQEGDLSLRQPANPEGQAGTLTREIVIAPATTRRAALLSVTFGPPGAVGPARMFFCRIYPQERVAH